MTSSRPFLQAPYPSLGRRKRWTIRKLFLLGVVFPDAMYHAIWGKNERKGGA